MTVEKPFSLVEDARSDDADGPSEPVDKPSREEAKEAVRTLLRWAGDDPDREGLKDTPARVESAYDEYIDGYNACLYPDENDNGSPIGGGNVLYRHRGGTEKSSFYKSGGTSRKGFGTANSNYFDGHADILKQRAPDRLFRLKKGR